MSAYIKEKEKFNKENPPINGKSEDFCLFCFCGQGRHVELGEVLIEYSYASSDENSGADGTQSHGMKCACAAEVNNNTCGDPNNIAAGFNLGKRKLVNGAYCAHKGIGSGEHQVCANDQNNAQS